MLLLLYQYCSRLAGNPSTTSSSITNIGIQKSQSSKEVIIRSSVLLLLLWVVLNSTVSAQVITGHILVEYTHEPISYATVKLENTNNEVVRHTSTDVKGSFTIEAPKAGEYTININRIGYTDNMAGPYSLGKTDTLDIEIRLLTKSVVLDEIAVTAKRDIAVQRLEDHGYFTRKHRNIGHFITREDIEKKNPVDLSDLFYTTPGVRVDKGVLRSKRNGCPMRVIFNGMKVFDKNVGLMLTNKTQGSMTSNQPNFSIDGLARPEDILGIEVYVSTVSQPLKFGRRTPCGIVTIWTK